MLQQRDPKSVYIVNSVTKDFKLLAWLIQQEDRE